MELPPLLSLAIQCAWVQIQRLLSSKCKQLEKYIYAVKILSNTIFNVQAVRMTTNSGFWEWTRYTDLLQDHNDNSAVCTISVEPDNYTFLAKCTLMLRRLGRLQEALEMFERVERLNHRATTQPGYHYCRGLFFWWERQPRGTHPKSLKHMHSLRSEVFITSVLS